MWALLVGLLLACSLFTLLFAMSPPALPGGAPRTFACSFLSRISSCRHCYEPGRLPPLASIAPVRRHGPPIVAISTRLPVSLGRYRPVVSARLLMPCPLPPRGAPPRPSRSCPAAHLRAPHGCPYLEGKNDVDRGQTRPLFCEEQVCPKSH